MYLKKLSVQGFKSFANRTVFDFTGGITAVVGPNGSGKSNVTDAIRWVLGEQSSRLLRAKKQEDVIFSGARDRKAVGMAEVILTLDNEDKWLPVDFPEIEIGRRAYRDGNSEYLLNGARVRLRDITELLMKGDVGQNSYTIMGQGLVDEVLSMTAEERREFLDEAADVKRFRTRMREANDRLVATRENMDRVQVVLNELEPRLAQLSRQAERAAEHSRLSAELADLLRLYYGQRWSEGQNAIVRARAALDQSLAEDAAAEKRLEAVREQLRTLGEEIRRRREAVARRDARSAELSTRLRAIEQATALDRERQEMVATRQAEIAQELASLQEERDTLGQADLTDVTKDEEIAAEVEKVTQEAALSRQALDAAEREYTALRSRMQELRDGVEADERRIRSAENEIAQADRRFADLERETEKNRVRRKTVIVDLRGYGQRFAELLQQLWGAQDDLEDSRTMSEQTRIRLRRVEDEVRAIEEQNKRDLRELDQLEGRLEALKRVHAEHDGVAAGTRNVLAMGQALIEGVAPGSLGEPPEIPGVIGLLARQIRVPPGMERAINAALEQRLHAVLIETEAQALHAVEVLSKRQQGRAQFVPLDVIRHVPPLNMNKEKGVVGVAARLVRCENRFRPLIDTLLGRVIVTEDIPTGQRMVRRGLGSVVTLDGAYIEPNGLISGGLAGSEEGLFSRQREIEELPEMIAEVRERTEATARQLEQGRATMAQLVQRANDADASYEQLRRAMDHAQAGMQRERDRLHKIRRDMEAIRSRQREVDREWHTREGAMYEARENISRLRQRRDERKAALVSLEQELKTALAARDTALKAVSEAGMRVAAIEGERKSLLALRDQHRQALNRTETQIAERTSRADAYRQEAAIIQERLTQLEAEMERVKAAQEEFGGDTEPDTDELRRLESHERQVQEELNSAQSALLAAQRRRLELEAEVSRWGETLNSLRMEMEREGLSPDRAGNVVPFDQMAQSQAVVSGSALADLEETRQRIEELRRRIRRLGAINEEAPEDYRETRERFEHMSTQMRDLEEAQDQLRAALDELGNEIRTRFAATFEVVNKSFGEYFQAFFGGGSATLVLTNPDDLAATGIDIEATPPGKRIRSLTLLSGGERSLTAVALLFALLTANPAPFCVLDEVDAALDEANVGRFTASLDRLSEKTQFMVVTHNRRTVEVADNIYGVSMGGDGISKVLSLRLGDLPKE